MPTAFGWIALGAPLTDREADKLFTTMDDAGIAWLPASIILAIRLVDNFMYPKLVGKTFACT